jgi:hypothetical protein
MPESPDADRIRHDALEEELEAARRKRDSYQALLKELPEVFEGKFRERIRPLQQHNEELLQEGLALREQIRRALPESPSSGSLPPAGGSQNPAGGSQNPAGVSQPASSAAPPAFETAADAPLFNPPIDPTAVDLSWNPPPSLDPAPARQHREAAAGTPRSARRRMPSAGGTAEATASARRLEELRVSLGAALGSLWSQGASLRPATLGAGLGLALLGVILGVLLPRQIPRSPTPATTAATTAATPGSGSAARTPAMAAVAGTLTLRSTGPSWVEVQTGSGNILYTGVLEGQRSFSLSAGLRVRSGRADLIRLRVGPDPERKLGPVEMIDWQTFPAASNPG